MTEITAITTWFTNKLGNGHSAHQAYRTQTPAGRTLLMTYCGRKLPSPQQAPDDAPRCKSCLRTPATP